MLQQCVLPVTEPMHTVLIVWWFIMPLEVLMMVIV